LYGLFGSFISCPRKDERISAKTMINKPRMSKWVGGMYTVLTIFIAIIFVAIAFGTNIRSSPLNLQILFFGLMAFVLFMMVFTTCSLYRTKYILQNGVLHSWSPFATINLKLRDIKKVERAMIPFHIRVGADLYSGRFYIPSLGWTKAIITNLSDGVMITTKDKKRYLITPSNPDRFIKLLKKK
jgi:hypothetical protein